MTPRCWCYSSLSRELGGHLAHLLIPFNRTTNIDSKNQQCISGLFVTSRPQQRGPIGDLGSVSPVINWLYCLKSNYLDLRPAFRLAARPGVYFILLLLVTGQPDKSRTFSIKMYLRLRGNKTLDSAASVNTTTVFLFSIPRSHPLSYSLLSSFDS